MRKLLVLALAFFSCADLGRNNPYDPDSKNYDSSLTGENNISSSDGSDNSSSSSSLASSSSSSSSSFPVSSYSSSVDEGTVIINTQIWKKINSDIETTDPDTNKCYNDESTNCDKYGRLYNWTAAKSACTSGFHLPTKEEWNALIEYVEKENDCSECAGKYLKAKSGWNDNDDGSSGNGNDSYDFSALPGGRYEYNNIGVSGTWWSANESDSNNAYSLGMSGDSDVATLEPKEKTSFRSVRCLKDQN